MSTFVKPATAGEGARCAKMIVLLGAALVLWLPLGAAAETGDAYPALQRTAMQADGGVVTNDTMRGGFELRCWQYGRLILEEHMLRLPPESASDVLRMTDKADRPVRILHTANATCLLKARPNPPRALRP